MDKRLAGILKFLGFLSIGLVILYLVYQRQADAYMEQCIADGGTSDSCSLVDKVVSDFGSAQPAWLLLTMLAFVVSNWSRAVRWNMLLGQLGYRPRLVNSFLTINLGYFANLGLPRMGEFVRAGSLSRYEGIPVEKVMGTVVVDRVVDVVCILLATALAVFFAFSQLAKLYAENADFGAKIEGLQTLLVPVFILGLLVLATLWFFRKRLLASSPGQRLSTMVQGFWEGIKTVRGLPRPGLFLLHTILIWLMYFFITFFCFKAFAPTSELGVVPALVTFVAGGWGIVVPSPGGMGSYHFLTGEALRLYGVGPGDAFSWSNIAFFTVTIGVSVILGLLALLLLPRLNRDYSGSTQQKAA